MNERTVDPIDALVDAAGLRPDIESASLRRAITWLIDQCDPAFKYHPTPEVFARSILMGQDEPLDLLNSVIQPYRGTIDRPKKDDPPTWRTFVFAVQEAHGNLGDGRTPERRYLPQA